MPNEIDIGALLNRVEDETLDLKATGYDLSSDDGRFALVKDVICMLVFSRKGPCSFKTIPP